MNCPECGGAQVAGKNCQQMLEDLHAWEWQIFELGALHFVFVAAFHLQHPSRLTPDARRLLEEGFVAFLDGKLTVDQIRSRASEAFEGDRRVRRPENDRSIVPKSWSMTIADAHRGTSSGVADRVMVWARSVRSELNK